MANHRLSNFSFQKGFRRGVPGCMEHATITGEALKDAKANRKNLTIVWIDLADAFGSVKHGLIFFTMKYFGINQKVLEYFKYCYSTLRVQVRVKDQMTEAIRFEVEVFQRCVASPTLFNFVFQLLLLSLDLLKTESYNITTCNLELFLAPSQMTFK